MFSSDDVQRRAANTGSGSGATHPLWLSPQPQTTPKPAPHPSVSPWLRRTVVGMIAFLTLSLFSVSMAHAVRVKDVATIEGGAETN